ncbi:MAG TPA: GxxExxY protein [Pyrinomonadaceae bacterium]
MKVFEPIPPETERAARVTVDAAVKVHKVLGPGLVESVYEACLAHELRCRGVTAETQVAFPVVYETIRLDTGLRLDLLVEKRLVVELKAVEKMNPLYEAQLLTYLKITGCRLGLLINFNVALIKDGIRRMVL